MRCADTRIIPVRRANKATVFTRQADGSAVVKTGDGKWFTLPDDDTLQAFVVWTMLNSELTETS